MSDINEILAKLDPKTRERLRIANEIVEKKQQVPSIGLNIALQGGLGLGRQHLVWGNKSAGKTSMLLQLIGQAQQQGKSCAFIDVEETYSPKWAERLGVDGDKLIVAQEQTITKCTTAITQLMLNKVDVIVVDSISSMLPSSYFDEEELKEVEKSKQIGQHARELGIASNMWNYSNDVTCLILVSQHRNKFGTMHSTLIPSGGETIQFNSSTIIKLFSTEATNEQIKGDVHNGDKIFEEQIGRPVTWTVTKNKQAPMNRTGGYDFYFDGDFVGIDTVGEVLDYAEKFGIIQKGGAWYTINDARFQGRSKAVAYLKDNPDVVEKLRDELFARIK